MASESQRLTDALSGAVAGSVAVAATAYAIDAWRKASERTVLDGKPTTLERVDSRAIKTDPATFQFKSGGDSAGVTDRLQGVKQWNAAAAGKVMVFERADGTRVIADGHQRHGLASRLVAGGHEPIKLDAIVLRERDGWQPRDVRAYAAIKNMHESSGNALDMAKVMRERPDLVTSSLPVTDAKIREAKALANLSEPAFKMVVGGAVKPEHAAAVGESVKEASRHVDMLTEMQKAKVASTQHARLYVQQAMAAPAITESSASLFGEEKSTRSLLKERAAVLDKAISALKSDKRIFGLLERESANIEAVGNKLSHEANASKAEGAGKLAELVEKLSTTRGRVSDMIDRAAMQVANGDTPAKAARALVKSVGDVMKEGGMKALTSDEPRRMVEMADAPKAPKAKGAVTLPGSRIPFDAAAETAHIAGLSDQRLSQIENANKARVTPNMAARHKIATDEIAKRKANPGWSDAARAASAEVRAADAKGQTSMLPEATTKDKIAAASRAKAAKGRTGDAMDVGLFGSSSKQTDLVDRARQVDEVRNMIHRAERARIEREAKASGKGLAGWSDAAREASAKERGVALPGEAKPKKPSPGKVKAAVQAVAGKPAPTGADLAKKIAANEKRSATMKAKAELKAVQKAAAAKAQSDERYANTGRAAGDAKAVAEAKAKVDQVRASKPRKPTIAAQRSAIQSTIDASLAEAAKLRGQEAQHRAAKYWDRANSAARGAAAAELRAETAKKTLSEMPVRGKKPSTSRGERSPSGERLANPSTAEMENNRFGQGKLKGKGNLLAKLIQGTPAPDKAPKGKATGTGPAGWSDAARTASLDVRQANAKPAEKLPPIVGPETPHEKMAKAGTLPKGENAWIAKQVVDLARDGRGSIGRRVGMEAYKTLVRTTGSNEAARAEIRAVMGKKTPAGGMFASGMTTDVPAKAPAKGRSKGSKALGVLAPIGLGVAMLAASNQAKAQGADAKGQIKAAAKEGVATGAHMAGFMAGTTVATAGLIKAGLTAARAVPAVSAALMVGGAIHGAATAKPGERLAGAAKGAWDMSLPGMIVNTAAAAKGAVSGRLSSEQAMDFSSRNEAYAAARPAAEDGPGGGPRGFANPANQAAAQQARGVENITEWAQGATPKGKMGPR